MLHLTQLLDAVFARVAEIHDEDDGFSTAELLGNAALGIVALVAIWAAMQQLGVDIVGFVRGQITPAGG